MTAAAVERATRGWPRRVLLVVLLTAGAVGLRVLEGTVVAGYRADVDAQALQAAAAVEGAVVARVGRLHSLQQSLAGVSTAAARRERFRMIAEEIQRSGSDVRAQYLIDTTGAVDALETVDTGDVRLRASRLRIVGGTEAFHAARSARAARISATVPLRDGDTGVVVYDPIVQGSRVVGFVGADFSYASLFGGPLARQLRSHTPIRVVDQRGATITRSPNFPVTLAEGDVSRLLTRDVVLPGDRRWRVQLLVGASEPFAARAALWLVGLALLGTLVIVALREERRAASTALQMVRLEGLSRSLLDANLRLEERAVQVAEANRAKSRFLAHVSHELRTPLNAILGYNALAREGVYGPLAGPLADAHERIRAASTHLLGVVDAVLDLSKLELNRLEIETADVRVDLLLAEVAAMIEPGAEAKGLRVDVVVEPSVPVLHTDARHLRRALFALAANAVRFTDAGSVTLAASYDGAADPPCVALAVADTGRGIAPEDHERIFLEFEQVRPPGRGDSITRGAGLGLAVARRLVHALGGTMHLASAPDAGARFVITLPEASFAGVARP
jgi:signal transduction histidine kinase